LSSLTSIFHLNISLAGKGSQGQIKQNMVKMQRCQQREQRRRFTVLLNQQWKKCHQLPQMTKKWYHLPQMTKKWQQ